MSQLDRYMQFPNNCTSAQPCADAWFVSCGAIGSSGLRFGRSLPRAWIGGTEITVANLAVISAARVASHVEPPRVG